MATELQIKHFKQGLDRDRIEKTKQEKEDRHSPRVVRMDEIVNQEG